MTTLDKYYKYILTRQMINKILNKKGEIILCLIKKQ
jgi:hypothetical protein